MSSDEKIAAIKELLQVYGIERSQLLKNYQESLGQAPGMQKAADISTAYLYNSTRIAEEFAKNVQSIISNL